MAGKVKGATAQAEFPRKLQFLFRPARYKVAWGGRGSAKSWSFARALLILGAKAPLRILCTREVQKSIKDSVHKLLSDQIKALGLSGKYDVLDTTIRGKNGTEFLFSGISGTTAENLKSYESVDICWVEEGQSISKRSWDILTPTIRKAGSEIWISMNPELATDETYRRFVANPPPDSIVERVNYTDNPWFTKELEAERQHAKLTMTADDYGNIWEGKCKKAASGAIYAAEIEAAELNRQIRPVPYDPLLSVHCIWDLGWNDQMTIIMVQKVASELRIIGYIEDSHRTLDSYINGDQKRPDADYLKKYPYNWGTDYLPHDGTHKDFKSGKSAEDILKALGRKVDITPNIGLEPGIKAARMMFGRVYFDEIKAARLIECLRRYKRNINQRTLEAGSPVHDEFSHGADAFRYLGVVCDMLRNEHANNGHSIFSQAAAQVGRRPASRVGY